MWEVLPAEIVEAGLGGRSAGEFSALAFLFVEYEARLGVVGEEKLVGEEDFFEQGVARGRGSRAEVPVVVEVVQNTAFCQLGSVRKGFVCTVFLPFTWRVAVEIQHAE